MMGFYNNLGWGFGTSPMKALFGAFLIPLILWSIFWKGWALWKAAKEDSKYWFIALLVINTAGILDILYIFLFSKKPYKFKK